MADADIFERINALSSEEEQLYGQASDGSGLSADERDRLAEIKVELDRCYDLLHQRQGRRDAGEDPSAAAARPARIVEGYEQ
ncbi:MAG: hypothetical protein QOG32_1556 [Chloroflexota bacterium]|jgi:hypothetical protein|nr:hypothetical protein [Chloroflexota bacterium]